MRRILVTGATGFVGGCVARTLAADPALSVTVTGRKDDPGIAYADRYVAGDLAEDAFVASLFAPEGFDTVIHAAALLTRRTDPGITPDLVRANVLATANLAAAAQTSGCRAFVYISSISVYGGTDRARRETDESDPVVPETPYGWSKLAGEQVAMAAADAGMAVACLRLAGVHGPGRQGGVIYAMLCAALAGSEIVVNEPNSRFRLLFVDDVARAMAALLTVETVPSGIFNLAGAEDMKLSAIAEAVVRTVRSSSPVKLTETASAVARNEVLATQKFQSAVGFVPEAFETHLRAMIAQMRS